MTEAEWLRCADVSEMLDFLADRVSSRKFRLFACACCRRLWHLLSDDRCRQAVEVAERFADGRADREELAAAREAALAVQPGLTDAPLPTQHACLAAAWAAAPASKVAAWAVAKNSDRKEQPTLLREIVGNPFRPPLPPPAWPDTALTLAQALYAGEKTAPALEKALAEAGHADLAEHFRWPAHPKGCWALDLILGQS